MSKVLCPALHHGLCINASGIVSRCCISNESNQTFKHVNDIENISEYHRHDENLKILKKQNIDGEWPDSCKNCLNKEKRGLPSRRLKFQRWHSNVDSEFSEEYPDDILHLDIALGNTCNQQCVMCNSNFSSKWLKDDIDIVASAPELRHGAKLSLKNWSLTYEQIDQIVENVTGRTKIVEFKGGEPLIDKKFSYFVEKVLEKNKEVKLVVTTNGTQFNDSNIELLKKVPNLSLSVSFDATGDMYDWIRGTSWSQAEKSARYGFVNLPHADVCISLTLSVYNLEHLKNVYMWTWQQKQDFDLRFIDFNVPQVVTGPDALNIKYASRESLRKGLEDLIFISSDPGNIIHPKKDYLGTLQTHIESLINSDEIDKAPFYKFHEALKKIRGWNIYE